MVGPEWRLKEKLNMRKAELKDLSLTENPEMKLAFELKERNQPGFVFFPSSEQERREWMAALTNLLTRRLVDAIQDTHHVYVTGFAKMDPNDKLYLRERLL